MIEVRSRAGKGREADCIFPLLGGSRLALDEVQVRWKLGMEVY
jgi:hypothetical protein